MKVNDLKKIIREEVTKVVRKELVGFVKLLGESNKPKAKPKQKIKKKPVTEQSLKDMLGDFENNNFQEPKPKKSSRQSCLTKMSTGCSKKFSRTIFQSSK